MEQKNKNKNKPITFLLPPFSQTISRTRKIHKVGCEKGGKKRYISYVMLTDSK